MTNQSLVEIYESEALGWRDDCFRNYDPVTGWVSYSAPPPAAESFANCGSIAGDYGIMSVTENAGSGGTLWGRSVLGLALLTNDYRVIRVRCRGSGTQPRFAVVVLYDDLTSDTFGWFTPNATMTAYEYELTAGKTISMVYLAAHSNAGNGNSATIDWDYVLLLKRPALVPDTEVEGIEVELQTTTGISGFRFTLAEDLFLDCADIWLKMDQDYGYRCYDSARLLTHGVFSAKDFDTGKYGYAWRADGVDNRITFGSALPARVFQTVLVWWQRKGDSGGAADDNWHCIVNGLNGMDDNRILVNKAGTQLKIQWIGGAGLVEATMTITDPTAWNRIGVIVDGVNYYIYPIVNGSIGAGVSLAGGSGSALDNLVLGWLDATHWVANGLIDEFIVLRRLPYVDAWSGVTIASATEIYRDYITPPLSGSARASVGDFCGIWLAGDSEALLEKLEYGRIIEREDRGEQENPNAEYIGEAQGETMLARSFTEEYAALAQISDVAEDIVEDQCPEFTTYSVDATNLQIRNEYDEDLVFDSLRKLAEAATFASGEKGANFWVDPGSDFHFEKLGKWAGDIISDRYAEENELTVKRKMNMKGDPKLANNIKFIWFEADYDPKNRDSLTECETGLANFADHWTCDAPDCSGVTILTETVDIKRGATSVHFDINTDPGDHIKCRCTLPSALDLATMDRLRIQVKMSGLNVDPDTFAIYMPSNAWGSYWQAIGMAYHAGAWHEYQLMVTMGASTFTAVGNPGQWVTGVDIQFNAPGGNTLGTGDIYIDSLYFQRDEKHATATDATSEDRYGARKHIIVDKTIKEQNYAQYLANGLLEQMKRPIVTINVTLRGKAQVGWRPPQVCTVYRRGDSASFQIITANHRFTPQSLYEVDLELVAAFNPVGTYEPKIVAPTSQGTISSLLRDLTLREETNEIMERQRYLPIR